MHWNIQRTNKACPHNLDNDNMFSEFFYEQHRDPTNQRDDGSTIGNSFDRSAFAESAVYETQEHIECMEYPANDSRFPGDIFEFGFFDESPLGIRPNCWPSIRLTAIQSPIFDAIWRISEDLWHKTTSDRTSQFRTCAYCKSEWLKAFSYFCRLKLMTMAVDFRQLLQNSVLWTIVFTFAQHFRFVYCTKHPYLSCVSPCQYDYAILIFFCDDRALIQFFRS